MVSTMVFGTAPGGPSYSHHNMDQGTADLTLYRWPHRNKTLLSKRLLIRYPKGR
ncbi:hypothetical protein [Arthrobacter sp. ZGTC131]|uniref:hypothetical protein n=1 Tax=Arthrobacter sp. ZGTC131 TaxID=2058898 RepID=UPI0015E3553E|nr:hypothetical protein [Arthrobacter sp. ZGTC131]